MGDLSVYVLDLSDDLEFRESGVKFLQHQIKSKILSSAVSDRILLIYSSTSITGNYLNSEDLSRFNNILMPMNIAEIPSLKILKNLQTAGLEIKAEKCDLEEVFVMCVDVICSNKGVVV